MIFRNGTTQNLRNPELSTILWPILIDTEPTTGVFGSIIVSGVWKTVTECYIVVSGVWKKVTEVNIVLAGAWKSN